jgi:hypothetical protein
MHDALIGGEDRLSESLKVFDIDGLPDRADLE